jgi:hypothetical protein
MENKIQFLWDPGIVNQMDMMLLVLSASYREVLEDCLADQELMSNTSCKVAALTWHSSITGTPFLLLNNTNYTWDPGVLYIIHDMMIDKYAVGHQVQFVQTTAEYLFLSSSACIQYIASDDINPVLHAAACGVAYILKSTSLN